jgi:hypothetical protein
VIAALVSAARRGTWIDAIVGIALGAVPFISARNADRRKTKHRSGQLELA